MNEPCVYRVSVKGIVIDQEGRVLLAREKDGSWDMLGGGLDHGEDPRACLAREVQEEAGLIVTNVSEAPLHFLTAPNTDDTIFVANVIYGMTLRNMEFTPSEECQELRFVSKEEAQSLQLLPNVQQLFTLL